MELARKEHRELTLPEHREIKEKVLIYLTDLLTDLRHKAEETSRVPGADFEVLRTMLAEHALHPHAYEDVGIFLNEKSQLHALAIDTIDEFLIQQQSIESIDAEMESASESVAKQREDRHAFIQGEMTFWQYAGKA